MLEEHVLTTLADDSGVGRSVAESRAVAVAEIFRGGLASLVGSGLFPAGASHFVSSDIVSMGAVVGGLALAGGGLAFAGTAVRHLARYGRTRVALIVGATAGLGTSTLLYGLSLMYSGFGLFPVLGRFNFLFAIGGMGFATFVILLTLGALLGLMVAPLEDSKESRQ
jgi:hypothetical protein